MGEGVKEQQQFFLSYASDHVSQASHILVIEYRSPLVMISFLLAPITRSVIIIPGSGTPVIVPGQPVTSLCLYFSTSARARFLAGACEPTHWEDIGSSETIWKDFFIVPATSHFVAATNYFVADIIPFCSRNKKYVVSIWLLLPNIYLSEHYSNSVVAQLYIN